MNPRLRRRATQGALDPSPVPVRVTGRKHTLAPIHQKDRQLTAMPISHTLGLRFNTLTIVESLGADDWLTGQRLYRQLDRLRLEGSDVPPTILLDAPTRSQVDAWFYWLRRSTLRSVYTPILHIEAHGSAEGLALADGSHLSWTELSFTLRCCNIATRNNLLVVLAACDAAHHSARRSLPSSRRLRSGALLPRQAALIRSMSSARSHSFTSRSLLAEIYSSRLTNSTQL